MSKLIRLKAPSNSRLYIVDPLARVRQERGDRDDVEQLPPGRPQVRQRVVGRVHVAPEGGVNNLPGGVHAPVGGVRQEEAVGHPPVVHQNVNCTADVIIL
jgi:hypothetical protein